MQIRFLYVPLTARHPVVYAIDDRRPSEDRIVVYLNAARVIDAPAPTAGEDYEL